MPLKGFLLVKVISRFENNLLIFGRKYAILLLFVFITESELRRDELAISYNKLWKLMIDHNMNKTQLRKEAGLSTNVIAKLSKNDSVSMDTLMRICKTLHCDVGDIVEVSSEAETDNTNGGEKSYGGNTDG